MTETTTLWRPTGPRELDEFNRHLVGPIEVVHEFRAENRPA
ncbi:hypothetical protein [Micromonospora aurantiaca (nom. illeg.)]